MGYKYHFSGSKASVNKHEPVYLTKFEATFVLPPPLQPKYGGELLTEQIKKVGGLTTDKLPETKEQFYRFHKRRYAGSVIDTNIDLEMAFEVNVNENNVTYPYNTIKDWCRLIYDPMTGLMMLKKDYTGSLTLEIHDKIGTVLRKVYFPMIFPIDPPNSWDLEYATDNIYEMTVKFAGENPTDLIIGSEAGQA